MPRTSEEQRRLVFITSEPRPAGTPDDAVAVECLRRRGVAVESVPWTKLEATSGDLLVLRSPWDYYHRLDEFLGWLERVERSGALLWNGPVTVRWNLHKRYLLGMAARGLPVAPTILLPRGSRTDLPGLLEQRGWSEAVLKPAVSASAHQTHRIPSAESRAHQPLLDRLCHEGDVLIQPFLPQVLAGELSFVFIAGRYSHAVRKVPGPGDFRVQAAHGGRQEPYRAPQEQVEQAARFLDAAPGPTLYARVDAVEESGQLVLMELELIEPELFFRASEDGVQRFAEALVTEFARS